MADIKDRIISLRVEKNMTQSQLAKALKISPSSIGMYEQGRRKPSYELLEEISDYFNVDMDYLMGRSEIKNKYQAGLKYEWENKLEENINMGIGNRLKQLRKDKKLTMVELSNILNEKYGLNLNYTMISKWENEKNIINNTNASAYCKYFKVSLDWLMYGNVKKNQQKSNYERIKIRRKELGISQEELANLVGYTDRSIISKIEKGTVDLSESKIVAIAKALKITPEYLVGWEENKSQQKSNIDTSYIYEETEFMKIPLYESISAGYGSCESEFVEFIAVPGLRPNGTTYFAVRVKGDSMEPKIPNGATIIIKKDIIIENGEIGAFYYNENNFVKQKKQIKDKLVLHSFNLAFDDIVVYEFDDFKEYGKVVKVMIDL